jgi:MFS family permease
LLSPSERLGPTDQPQTEGPRGQRAFRISTLGSALENAGSAATWTGLPVYVSDLTGDPRQLATLFTVGTVATIVMSLPAGSLTDRYRPRRLVIASGLCSAASLLALYVFLAPQRIWPFYLAGFVSAAAATVGSTALGIWLASLAPAGRLATWFGRRGAWLSGSKLLGTGGGPLLFHLLGKSGLLIDALTMLGATVLYAAATKLVPSGAQPAAKRVQSSSRLRAGLQVMREDRRVRRLIAVALSAGLLGPPVTAACLELLRSLPQSTDFYFSAFWAIGFAGSILANSLLAMGRFERLDQTNVMTGCFLTAATILLGLAHAWVPAVFLAGFVFVVVCRTLLGTVLSAELITATPIDVRGRVSGVAGFLGNGATFAALSLFATVPPARLRAVFSAYVIVVAVGGYLALRRSSPRTVEEQLPTPALRPKSP